MESVRAALFLEFYARMNAILSSTNFDESARITSLAMNLYNRFRKAAKSQQDEAELQRLLIGLNIKE